jgi:hypothetical protein
VTDILSPDCRDGKCGACIGDAWDDTTDEPTVCQHACHDPDLPADVRFVAASPVVEIGGLLANVIPKSIDEQRAIHHNQARYAELQKLRLGQPNRYEETRYR